MIKLADLQPFAGGQKRNCYFHPNDDNKIIKIIPPNKSPEVLHSQKFWLRRLLQNPEALNANRAESEKYEKLKKKLGNLRDKLPYLVEFFGKAETDLGEGLVFQAVKNFDGQISESVVSASETGGYDRVKLLESLKAFAAKSNDGLIFNDVGKNNVVVQILEPGHVAYKLWIVDGINCGPLIPISEYSNMYASIRKAKKIWQLKKFILKNF